jgi:hypothetical protein
MYLSKLVSALSETSDHWYDDEVFVAVPAPSQYEQEKRVVILVMSPHAVDTLMNSIADEGRG